MRIPIPYLEVCLLLNHESQTSCDTVYAAGKAVSMVLCSSIPDTDRMEIITAQVHSPFGISYLQIPFFLEN